MLKLELDSTWKFELKTRNYLHYFKIVRWRMIKKVIQIKKNCCLNSCFTFEKQTLVNPVSGSRNLKFQSKYLDYSRRRKSYLSICLKNNKVLFPFPTMIFLRGKMFFTLHSYSIQKNVLSIVISVVVVAVVVVVVAVDARDATVFVAVGCVHALVFN